MGWFLLDKCLNRSRALFGWSKGRNHERSSRIEDVVVKNGNHNPVQNLKAGDFTVIDGRVQHLRNFEEHAPNPGASARAFSAEDAYCRLSSFVAA
jgi:hypothetical protein